MFGRGKGKGKGKGKEPVANTLSGEAKPNTLSWVATDAEAAETEFAEDELVDEEELDEEDEVDERTLAQRRADLQAELDRQAEEFGLTGSNPTAIYGPNGEAVEAVLDALSGIDMDQAERLADAWVAIDETDREILERDLLRPSRNGEHGYELTAAEDSVTAWLNARTPADEDEAALWAVVAEAASGAVDALILDDELDDADYDLLYGAWAAVMDPDDESEEPEGEAADEAADGGEPDGEFGPNTELVRQFLAKLGELNPDQLTELTAFWNGQSKSDLRQAHRAMQELAKEDGAWREQVRAAQDQITTWTHGRHRAIGSDAGTRTIEVDVRFAARLPATDAVTALVLADLLEPEDAEALYAAWEATVGQPKLPKYEDDGTS